MSRVFIRKGSGVRYQGDRLPNSDTYELRGPPGVIQCSREYLKQHFDEEMEDDWDQLYMDFLECMDNNEITETKADSDIYCNCSNPDIKLNEANFITFKYCKKCKKERAE